MKTVAARVVPLVTQDWPADASRGCTAVPEGNLRNDKVKVEAPDDLLLRVGMGVSIAVLLMLLLAASYVVWAKIEFAWPLSQ